MQVNDTVKEAVSQ